MPRRPSRLAAPPATPGHCAGHRYVRCHVQGGNQQPRSGVRVAGVPGRAGAGSSRSLLGRRLARHPLLPPTLTTAPAKVHFAILPLHAVVIFHRPTPGRGHTAPCACGPASPAPRSLVCAAPRAVRSTPSITGHPHTLKSRQQDPVQPRPGPAHLRLDPRAARRPLRSIVSRKSSLSNPAASTDAMRTQAVVLSVLALTGARPPASALQAVHPVCWMLQRASQAAAAGGRVTPHPAPAGRC